MAKIKKKKKIFGFCCFVFVKRKFAEKLVQRGFELFPWENESFTDWWTIAKYACETELIPPQKKVTKTACHSDTYTFARKEKEVGRYAKVKSHMSSPADGGTSLPLPTCYPLIVPPLVPAEGGAPARRQVERQKRPDELNPPFRHCPNKKEFYFKK